MDKYTFFVTLETKYDIYATSEDSANQQVREFLKDDIGSGVLSSLNTHIELHRVEPTDRR